MYRVEPELLAPSSTAILWRYMDFTKLVSLLENNTLFFPRADKLGDPYEGFLSERYLKSLQKSFTKQANPSANIYWNITQVFKTICTHTLISCWHESIYESAAMWKCYAESRDSVAIKTTFDSLCRSLVCESEVFVGKVSYIDYDSPNPVGIFDENDPLWRLQDKTHPLILRSQFFKKRKAFSYEQEVRAISPLSIRGLFSGGMTNNIPEPSCGVGEHLDVDLRQLLHEIVISPFASGSFFDLVSSVVERYEIEVPVKHSSIRGVPIWT